MTIIEYIKKTDVTFNKLEFNEVDNLAFSKLVYFHFDHLFKDKESITIKEAYKLYLKNPIGNKNKDNIKTLKLMAQSKRYGNLKLFNFVDKRDVALEKQFAAITIGLNDETIFVAFRGTDNTLIGIKEDFNMSYMMKVPSQEEGVRYLNQVLKKNKYNVILGGHSKGGNIAIYAASFCKMRYKHRILAVYNNDGPGFFNKITKSSRYRKMLPKVKTYLPQTSVVGRLLYNDSDHIIVKSKKMLIMQHDMNSWEVKNNLFVRYDHLNKESKYIEKVFKSILTIPEEERAAFFNIFYNLLTSTGAKTIGDLSKQKIKTFRELLANYKKLDEEQKKIFTKVWKEIVSFSKITMNEYLQARKEKTK